MSSANFTERGQQRNLEAGVLIHDAPFALQLERQWKSLIASSLTYRFREIRRDSVKIDAEASAASGKLEAAWQIVLEETFNPDALSQLAQLGAPPPDEVGSDCEIDNVVVATLEWCWHPQRVALIAGDHSDDVIARLAGDGWRTVCTTDESSLSRLHAWLTGGEG